MSPDTSVIIRILMHKLATLPVKFSHKRSPCSALDGQVLLLVQMLFEA